MGRTYLASDVIASVKRRALLSASGNTPFTDDDWHALMDEEVRGYIWPMLRGAQEDFFVRRLDITVVAGTAEYRLPRRVLGESLKAVLQSDGGTPARYNELNRVRMEEQSLGNVGFWVEDDRIVLNPVPDASRARPLRLLYHLRPSKVVAASACYKVVSRNGVNLTADTGVTYSGAPDITCDVVMGVPGLRPVVMDFPLTDVLAGPPVVFEAQTAWATDWAISALEPSYLCQVEETPIPNIPFECFPLLAQRLAVLALEGRSGWREANDRLTEMRADTERVFRNRFEANDEVIDTSDAPGRYARRTLR